MISCRGNRRVYIVKLIFIYVKFVFRNPEGL